MLLLNLYQVSNLFKNIIAVSEIETGEINVEKEIIDCNKVLRSVHSKKIDEAKKKGLNFYLVFEKKGLLVNIDWFKLEKIVYSLTDNAIKYTKAGEVLLLSRASGRRYSTTLGSAIQRLYTPRASASEG